MPRRSLLFLALGLVVAAVCVRLGIWQLDRLAERRGFNAQLRARTAMPAADFADLPRDTASARYRRIRLRGTWDFDREILLANRSRQGSPGVNIVTPLLMPGTDTAILVNRGWVYAPDGMTIDLPRWREAREVSGEGYVQTFGSGRGDPRTGRIIDAWRWMDRPTLAQEFPYPIAPWYAVFISGGDAPGPNVPPRLAAPALDEGPHRGYAFQWFSFAAIALAGTIIFVRRK